MIAHSDELTARAERWKRVVDRVRLEGEAKGWREAAATWRTRRP